MGINAFTSLGKTVKLVAAVSPPTPVQVPSTSLGGNQYRVINLSTTTSCFLAFSQTAADATTTTNTMTTSTTYIYNSYCNVSFKYYYYEPNTSSVVEENIAVKVPCSSSSRKRLCY